MIRLLWVCVAACLVGVGEGGKLAKLGLLRCSACKVTVEKMIAKKQELLEEERQPVQVSHRLGNGKWDPHGDGGVKKLDYSNSELMAIEAIEGLCSSLTGYTVRHEANGDRAFSTDSTLTKAESYNKGDADVIDNPTKALKNACNELLDDYDEKIHDLIREISDAETLKAAFCEKTTKACKNIDKLREREAKNKEAHEERKRKKVEKTREAGTAKSVHLADLHFSVNGVDLNLTALLANASSTGANHPYSEGPEKGIDNDPKTKWLDHNKTPLVVEFHTEVTIDAFSYTTANDFPDRDPVRWHFEASNAFVEKKAAVDAGDQQGAKPESEPGAEKDGGAEKEGSTEPEASEQKEPEPEPEPEPERIWVSLHTQLAPFDVPQARGVRLPLFSLEQPATYKVFRFRPVFGDEKKATRKKKKKSKAKQKADKPKKGADKEPAGNTEL